MMFIQLAGEEILDVQRIMTYVMTRHDPQVCEDTIPISSRHAHEAERNKKVKEY